LHCGPDAFADFIEGVPVIHGRTRHQ
jgi:hypothetical protein